MAPDSRPVSLSANPNGFFRRLSIRRKDREDLPVSPTTPRHRRAATESEVSDKSGSGGKYWAQQYLLDPLTAPEPSQETGPGASLINPRNTVLNRQVPRAGKESTASFSSGYPTPPSSASPSRSQFHPSNPFSDSYTTSSRRASTRDADEDRLFQILDEDIRALGRSESRASTSQVGGQPGPSSPNSERPRHRPRPNSVQHLRYPPASGASRSQSMRADPDIGIGRHRSLRERYPGDMSHRPLDQIKRETRAADRAPHLRKRGMTGPDTIDSLDTTGPVVYHHDGPYDATLASRNSVKRYAPVEAVRETNMEALKATPREYIQDSLKKHMPLQGTATIPPGGEDFSGRRMSYEEGADLMREPDAAGGAYRRWEGVQYHPEDLKGKGEPSFTVERDINKKPATRVDGNSIELQSTRPPRESKSNGVTVRQRSSSNVEAGPSRQGQASTEDSDIRRNKTSGKRLSDGLKRRFNSVRHKQEAAV